MHLNKKGFTLIELLAVIVLLGIIIGISSPTIVSIISNSKAKTREVSIANIKKSAVLYTKENSETVDWVSEDQEEYTCVYLEDLITNGTIKKSTAEELFPDESLDNIAVKVKRDPITKSISKENIGAPGTCTTNINITTSHTATSDTITANATCETDTGSSNSLSFKLDDGDWSSSASGTTPNTQSKTYTSLKKLTTHSIYTKCTYTKEGKSHYKIVQNNIITANYGTLIINTEPSTCSKTKKISITIPQSETSIDYSLDGKNWKSYTGPFSISQNSIIYARYKNDTNKYRVITKTVTTIDSSTPQITNITAITTNNSATVNYTASNTGICGTPSTELTYYPKNNPNQKNTITCSDGTCNIPNLKPGTTYIYSLTIKNKNGETTRQDGSFNTRGVVNISFNTNGGTVTASTNYNYKTDSNGIISVSFNKNNNYTSIFHTIPYGQNLGNNGLANYNNPSYLNITRNGYNAKSGEEWFCESGCRNSTYNQDTNYKDTDFCDVSTKDCNITLKVNWIDNIPPTTPTITNPTNGSCTSNSFSLTLKSSDTGSGIAYYQYSYSSSATTTGTDANTQWVTYANSASNTFTTTPFSVARNQPVYVRACDNDGNCSEKSSTNICIVNNLTLTYNNNGGSGCSSKTVTYGQQYGTLCTPSRTGYSFKGWYTALDGGSKITASSTVNVTNNQTIYARWEDNIAPELTLVNPYNGEWTNTTFTANYQFSDRGTGINPSSLSWSTDGGSSWAYISNNSTESYADTWTAERNSNVLIKICDYAGNCTQKSMVVKIDKTCPTMDITSTRYDSSFSEAPHAITTTFYDSGSGINIDTAGFNNCFSGNDNSICCSQKSWYSSSSQVSEYRVGIYDNPYELNFQTNRTNTIFYRVCDYVGNCSYYRYSCAQKSKVAPNCSYVSHSNSCGT